jgi:hypothetical protein
MIPGVPALFWSYHQMRTSGASTESRMTIAMAIIALGVAMLLAGGPANLMQLCENSLRTVAESVYQGWLAFRG